MERSDEIIMEIIQLIYPEWIICEKEKRKELSGYEQYASILRDVFQYDLARASAEQDHALDLTELERKIKIMKLNSELKQQGKKEKKK